MNPIASPSPRHAALALPARSAAPVASPSSRRLDSGSLLAGCREIIIVHAGCEYRLRRTQNDKLILTK